jgi:hypothetical protein
VYKEVLYCRQSPSERVQRHRRVAAALEAASAEVADGSSLELAFHFKAGELCSESVRYLRAAAANAMRRYAAAEAAALLEEARKLASDQKRGDRTGAEVEILNELGAAYFVSGDFESCSRVWHQAAVNAMKHGRGDVAVSVLARLALPIGWDNVARLRACADQVMSQIQNVHDDVTRAEITIRTLALVEAFGSWKKEDRVLADQALEEISRCDDPLRVACARISHAWLRLRDAEYQAAINEVEGALDIVLQHRAIDVVRGEWVLGWALLHTGEWGRMQSVAKSAAAHANKNGNSRIEALFTNQLAWLHVECGAFASAREMCVLSDPTWRGRGSVMRHVIAAMAEVGLRDADSALARVESARRLLPPGERFWRALAEMARLNARLLKHDLTEARRSARRLLQLTEGMPEKTWKAIALACCARAAALDDRASVARETLDAAFEIVEGADLPLAEWHVNATAAEIFEKTGDGAQFAKRSRELRSRLFQSLSSDDPLLSSASAALERAHVKQA